MAGLDSAYADNSASPPPAPPFISIRVPIGRADPYERQDVADAVPILSLVL